MRYQVKAAVPVAISPAGPVEYPKIGGYVEIPSREHAGRLQDKGILFKNGEEHESVEDEEHVVYNLHKMTRDEMDELPDAKFEKLAGEDADMTRIKGQSIEDFRDDVDEALKQMAKMSEKSLQEMDKNELEAFAKEHLDIDIDKRKSEENIIQQIEELLTNPKGD